MECTKWDEKILRSLHIGTYGLSLGCFNLVYFFFLLIFGSVNDYDLLLRLSFYSSEVSLIAFES